MRKLFYMLVDYCQDLAVAKNTDWRKELFDYVVILFFAFYFVVEALFYVVSLLTD